MWTACCEMGPINVFNVYFLTQISQQSHDMKIIIILIVPVRGEKNKTQKEMMSQDW